MISIPGCQSSANVQSSCDTNVSGEDFGVPTLWSELTAQFPGFAFLHSNRLGVAAVGTEQSEAIRHLMSASAEPENLTRIRRLFGSLGAGVFHRVRHETARRSLAACRQAEQAAKQSLERLTREKAAAESEKSIQRTAKLQTRLVREVSRAECDR